MASSSIARPGLTSTMSNPSECKSDHSLVTKFQRVLIAIQYPNHDLLEGKRAQGNDRLLDSVARGRTMLGGMSVFI